MSNINLTFRSVSLKLFFYSFKPSPTWDQLDQLLWQEPSELKLVCSLSVRQSSLLEKFRGTHLDLTSGFMPPGPIFNGMEEYSKFLQDSSRPLWMISKSHTHFTIVATYWLLSQFMPTFAKKKREKEALLRG